MKITLYSTGCPKCKVLTTKLDNKNIKYSVVSDVDIITAKDIFTVPVLEINGKLLDFKEAIDWLNER